MGDRCRNNQINDQIEWKVTNVGYQNSDMILTQRYRQKRSDDRVTKKSTSHMGPPQHDSPPATEAHRADTPVTTKLAVAVPVQRLMVVDASSCTGAWMHCQKAVKHKQPKVRMRECSISARAATVAARIPKLCPVSPDASTQR